MNKKKVIELVNLFNDENFISCLKKIGNFDDLENCVDFNRVFDFTDDEIDGILNTDDINLKAYKVYTGFCNKRYKLEQRKELINILNKNIPEELLSYLIVLCNNNVHYRVGTVIEMVKKALGSEVFMSDIVNVLSNENISITQMPKFLESFVSSKSAFNNAIMKELLNNENFVNHYDASRILEVISKEEDNDKVINMYSLLIREGIIKDVGNLSYILGIMSNADSSKFDISCKLLKNKSIQKLCSPRNVIESVVDSSSAVSASVVGTVSLNEKLQESDCYYNVLKLLKLSKGVSQSFNGKKMIEYLQDEEMIDKVSVNKLVNAVVNSKDADISNDALLASQNKLLQGHKNYEDIVYSIGTSSSSVLSNKGVSVISKKELMNHPKLLKIVNFITSSFRDEKCCVNAYNLILDEDLIKHKNIDELVESVASAKNKIQSDLAYQFAISSSNKELDGLSYIVKMISSADMLEKSKIIYGLGSNKDIMGLRKEGIAILEEVYCAKDMDEVNYILNEKYNINNLVEFIRITEVLKKDVNLIIHALNYLEDDDFDKDTVIKKKVKCKK